MKKVSAFLILGLAGIAMLLSGLSWDSVMHAADPTLAEREGIFTLTNPAHALFASGAAVATAALFAALYVCLTELDGRRWRSLGMRAAYLAMAIMLVGGSGGVVAWTQTLEHGDDMPGMGQMVHDSNISPDGGMPGMSMPTSGDGMAGMPGMGAATPSGGTAPAASSGMAGMSMPAPTDLAAACDEMEAGPHMYMAPMPPASDGDMQTYMQELATAKASLSQYSDVAAAERDGYEPPAQLFPPTRLHPQQCYHFTNHANALQENLPNGAFDPGQPASLLYARQLGDSSYSLVGVMWMAPYSWTADQVNQRVPMSVQQWHEHIDICNPPAGAQVPLLGPAAQFGLAGSISTPDACAQAGGTFQSHLYGWMAHAFPFSSN